MKEVWNPQSVKEYVDALLKAEAERARVLSENFEKRMDNTNEWRAVIERLLDNYVSRSTLYSSLFAVAAIITAVVAIIGVK